MQRALYVEQINDDLLRSAFESCAASGSINVDERHDFIVEIKGLLKRCMRMECNIYV